MVREYHFPPAEVMQMPLAWLMWLMTDPKEIDKQARYRQMTPEVRETAERVRKIYGRF